MRCTGSAGAVAVDMPVAVAGRMGFEEVMLVVVDLVALSVAVSVVVVAFSSAASAIFWVGKVVVVTVALSVVEVR